MSNLKGKLVCYKDHVEKHLSKSDQNMVGVILKVQKEKDVCWVYWVNKNFYLNYLVPANKQSILRMLDDENNKSKL